ncbi:hypothetical protein EMIHUDRAFT_224447 [Emiliania huxleyi CCMP1516]|uniref:Uncharacterized protein n=2 Tax=Emiliania huxleyi TaxID=2903 RepID=A0A0D3KSB3_EMIH1|nr:hypothetical protein EMIHUDRAFT_224447 [Emiliania huxleyi CCMP1516]EOD38648.1 hypothetical protein EMIHUDRAFT_224447 [Emiliania huxleyi CCMP1516]|eukprot:XP_005791077.1 hypothetical protein EMIHUDRAFT_224447 [Emiliania huxleyi CCMP1516]
MFVTTPSPHVALLGWWVWDHSQDTLEGWELRVSSTAGAVSPACGGLPPEGYNSASEAEARVGRPRP